MAAFNLTGEISLRLAKGAAARLQSAVRSAVQGSGGSLDLKVNPASLAQLAAAGRSASALAGAYRAADAASRAAAAGAERFTASLTLQGAAARSASAGLTGSATAARAAARAYADGGDAAANFGRQAVLAGRRFAAFSLSAGPIVAFVSALRSGASEAARFDLAMNKVVQVADDGARGVAGLRAEIGRLATTLGVSSRDLAEGAVAITQAGIAGDKARVAMEALALSLVSPNFGSAKETVDALITTYQAFGKDVGRLKDQLGAMNAIAGSTAVDAADLATAVSKAGGAFSTAGGQLEELLAVFTAVRSTTRESADEVATSLKTIFARVQRNDTVEMLRDLGVSLRYSRAEAEALGRVDLTDQFVGPFQAAQRLAQGLSRLRSTDPRYSQIVEELGGYRNISRVLPLVQQFGEAQKALNIARLGGASLEAAAATRQDALVTKLTRVRETYQQLSNDLVQNQGLKAFVDGLTTAATAASEVVKALSPLLPVLAVAGTARLASSATRAAYGALTPAQFKPAAVAPRKFANGGPVTGGTPGQDSVAAALTPGEFVLRKQAVDGIGPDRVRQMNRTGRLPGYAGGGPVVDEERVRRVLGEYEKSTGVPYSRLVTRIALTPWGVEEHQRGQLQKVLAARGRDGALPNGSFDRKSGTLTLNTSTLQTEQALRRTLAHELGHALDFRLGGGRYKSKGDGLVAAVAGDYAAGLRAADAAKGRAFHPGYAAYRYSPEEGFAEAHAAHLTGRSADPRLGAVLRQAAWANSRNPLFRGLAWVQRRFVRFADGGQVDRLAKYFTGDFAKKLEVARGQVRHLFPDREGLFDQLLLRAMKYAEGAHRRPGAVGAAAAALGDAAATRAPFVGFFGALRGFPKGGEEATPEALLKRIRNRVYGAVQDEAKLGDVRISNKTVAALRAAGHDIPDGGRNKAAVAALRQLIAGGATPEDLRAFHVNPNVTYPRLAEGSLKGIREQALGGEAFGKAIDARAAEGTARVLLADRRPGEAAPPADPAALARKQAARARAAEQALRESVFGSAPAAPLGDPRTLRERFGRLAAERPVAATAALVAPPPAAGLTREFLELEYAQRGRSAHEIAALLGTYPNAVRRALKKHGFALRGLSEAQANALATGRAAHPTKGKGHSAEARAKLSAAARRQYGYPGYAAGGSVDAVGQLLSRRAPRVSAEEEQLARLFEDIRQGQRVPSPAVARLIDRFILDSDPVNLPLLAGGRPGPAARRLADYVRSLGLPRDLQVHRGVGARGLATLAGLVGADPFSAAAVGRTFEYPGFMSTSLSPATAAEYGKAGTLAVHLPAGFPAAAIGRATRRGAGQSEILLPPGQRFRVAAAGRLQAFRKGGEVNLRRESDQNMAVAERHLDGLGIGGIRLRGLANSLLFVGDGVLPEDVQGGYNQAGRAIVLRGDSRLDTVAHEVAHAASHRWASIFGGGRSRFAAAIPGNSFSLVGVLGQSLLPRLLGRDGLAHYRAQEARLPGVLRDEGMAYAVSAYVHQLRADAGGARLPDHVRAALAHPDAKLVMGAVEKLLLPDIRRLSHLPVAPPAPAVADPNLKRLGAALGLAGRTVRPTRLAAGGLVPGPAGDWTDSVPAALPVGSYVVRKSSVNAVGAANLAALASGQRFATGGTVPALVMPGEYIFSPQEAARVGRPTLDAVNRTGKLPGFADGGPVGGTPRRRPGEVIAPLSSFADPRFVPLLKAVELAAARLGIALTAATRVLVEFVNGVPHLRQVLGEAPPRGRRLGYTPVPASVTDAQYDRMLTQHKMRGVNALALPSYREAQQQAKALGIPASGRKDDLVFRVMAARLLPAALAQDARFARFAAEAAGPQNRPLALPPATSQSLTPASGPPVRVLGFTAAQPPGPGSGARGPLALPPHQQPLALPVATATLVAALARQQHADRVRPLGGIDTSRTYHVLPAYPDRRPGVFRAVGGYNVLPPPARGVSPPQQPARDTFRWTDPATGRVYRGTHDGYEQWVRQFGRRGLSHGYGVRPVEAASVADAHAARVAATVNRSEAERHARDQRRAALNERVRGPLPTAGLPDLPAGGSLSTPSLGARELAVARYRSARDAAGGLELLGAAPGLREHLRTRTFDRAQAELAAGIERQLRVLYPAIDATTRRRVAEEQAATALQKNAQVLRDASGRFQGLASLGQQLSATGSYGWLSGHIDEAGRGRFGRFADRLGAVGGVTGWVGRQLGKGVNLVGANSGTTAAISLMTLAPYAGQALEPSKEAAEVAARTGDGAAYRRGAAGAGLLQGAALGAAAGLVFGPWGAAVGAAVGGLHGLTSSLRQASRDIGDARLGLAVQRLSETFKDVSDGKLAFSLVDQSRALSDIRAGREEVARKARESTEGFFGSAVDPRRDAEAQAKYLENLRLGRKVEEPRSAAVEARTKELRAAFGGQAGYIIGALTGEAQKVAERSPKGDPAVLAGALTQGLKGELVRLVADIRGVPVATVLREFTETVRDAQQNVLALHEAERGRAAAERAANAGGRLALAFETAASTVTEFHSRMQVAALAFGGHGAVLPVGLGDGLSQLGAANPAAYRRSVAALGGILGEPGAAFVKQAQAADEVGRVLPGVLAELARHGVDERETTGTRGRRLLEETLLPGLSPDARKQALEDNKALADAIQTVVGGLDELERKEKGSALREIRKDAEATAKSLNARNADPVTGPAARMLKQLDELNARFAEGLVSSRQYAQQVGEGRDRAVDARLGLLRARAEVSSEALGGGDPARLLGLNDLLDPFRARQARLLAGTGLGNEDVAGISGRLARVRQDAEVARQARDAAAADPKLYQAASASFDRLVGEAERLQQALKNLADPVQKAAALQERLNQLSADRDSRLGFAKRWVNAGPDERLRLARGQRLAARVNEDVGLFKRLTQDDQRLVLEAAQLIGNSQFQNGRTGYGLKVEALKTTGIVPAGLEAERARVLGEKAATAGTAVTAQDALTRDLAGQNEKFLAGLHLLHERFFRELAANLAGDQLVQARNAIGLNRSERGLLTAEERQRDLLARVGVTKQEELDRLRPLKGDVQDYLGVVRDLKALGAGSDVEATRRVVAGKAATDVDGVVSNLDLVTQTRTGLGTQAGIERNTRAYLAAGTGRKFLTDSAALVLPGYRSDAFEKNAASLNRRDEAIRSIIDSSGVTAGFSPEGRNAVVDSVTRGFREEYDLRVKWARKQRGGADLDDQGKKQLVAEVVADLTAGAVAQQTRNRRSTLEARETVLAAGLGRAGVSRESLDQLKGLAGSRDGEDLLKAIESGFLRETGKSLDNLTGRIHENEAAFRRLTESAEALQKKFDGVLGRQAVDDAVAGGVAGVVGVVAQRRALGGPIFQARGTDTVPAMLTPEEFVVNARSSRANRALLHRINEARGPVRYLAEGGTVKKVFDAYEDARHGISEGLRWLGLARGGVVPQYLAGGGLAGRSELLEAERRRLAAEQLRAAYGGAIAAQNPDRKYAAPPAPKGYFRRWADDFQLRAAYSDSVAFNNPTRRVFVAGGPGFFGGRARLAAFGMADPHGEVGLDRLSDGAAERARKLIAAGKLKPDHLGSYTAGELRKADARRQVGSLLYRQALASAGVLPGEDEQFGAAEARVGAREERDAARFRRRFAAGFATVAEQERQRRAEAAAGRAEKQAEVAEERRRYRAARGPYLGSATVIGPAGTETRVRRFAEGGLVPGTGAGDSVGALLTPGEYVLPRAVVQQLGLPRVQRFAEGGLVGGHPPARPAAVEDGFERHAQQMAKLGEAMTSFAAPAQSLASALTAFGSNVDRLVGALERFPTSVEHQGRFEVNVLHNGSEVFREMNDAVATLIDRKVSAALNQEFDRRFPEAPAGLRSDPTAGFGGWPT